MTSRNRWFHGNRYCTISHLSLLVSATLLASLIVFDEVFVLCVISQSYTLWGSIFDMLTFQLIFDLISHDHFWNCAKEISINIQPFAASSSTSSSKSKWMNSRALRKGSTRYVVARLFVPRSADYFIFSIIHYNTRSVIESSPTPEQSQTQTEYCHCKLTKSLFCLFISTFICKSIDMLAEFFLRAIQSWKMEDVMCRLFRYSTFFGYDRLAGHTCLCFRFSAVFVKPCGLVDCSQILLV